MFDGFQYVPILKGRQGEYGALQTTFSDAKPLLAPLIEIPPIPWDYKASQPGKTIDEHLRSVAGNIERAWGCFEPIFIDLMWIEDGERMVGGVHPLSHVFATIRNRGIQAIPVTGLARHQAYQEACREVIRMDGRGLCLRLQREDFDESDDLASQTSRLLSDLGACEREADLLLDLRAISPADINGQAGDVIAMIDALPQLTSWRSFVLAGTAFPDDLMGLPPSARSAIPRAEWALWTELISSHSLPRVPTFGDYAIASPQPSEVDPRIMRPSASIRYTAEQSWIILKGRNLRDHGFAQFHQVSQALLGFPEYSGSDFSWGDRYISDCAGRLVGTGNLTTWRKVGTSHHVAYVLQQLANFSDV